MSRIFISYRRQDSAGIAGRIFDKLSDHFGDGEVFLDFDKIPPGIDFREHIATAMDRAGVMLAVLGDTWLGVQGPNGRRLDDPKDYVRIELEMAHARGIPVIPVLLGQTTMPKATELPESIAWLAHKNAAHVDIGRDFHPHMERLIRNIERHMRPGGVLAELELLGEDTSELLQHYFKECDALIAISPEHILVTRPKTALIGFRNLINALWAIERSDGKKRPLIWVLDLGRQRFEDTDARMKFLNAQSLLTRFRALKRFEDNEAKERWQWLQSRAVVLLLDTCGANKSIEPIKRPTFSAHHVSLATLDLAWLDSDNFRKLYGDKLDRIRERTFNVFYNGSANWSSVSEFGENRILRYFGYTLVPTDKAKSDFQGRGLELPELPTHYEEAFDAVSAAGAYMIDIKYPAQKRPLISGREAIQVLNYLGYLTLRLEDFVESY